METNRIVKIILMEFATDILKLEDELEKTINSDLEINKKTLIIKHLLSRLVAVEGSIVKFNTLTNNNNKLNQQENGTNN